MQPVRFRSSSNSSLGIFDERSPRRDSLLAHFNCEATAVGCCVCLRKQSGRVRGQEVMWNSTITAQSSCADKDTVI